MSGPGGVTVSVALCTHNGERFLSEQLASIGRQSRLPDEVVIGDDRSSDGTADLVERFAAGVPFPVRYLKADERLGTARNFERTIAAATGDVIVLADQDDVWRPEKLARLATPFEVDTALAFSDGGLIDEAGTPVEGTCWGRTSMSVSDVEALARDPFATLVDHQLRFHSTAMGATMAFAARHRDVILPFPDWLPASGKGLLLHDGWIALGAAALGPVVAIPERLIDYRVHARQQIGLAEGRPHSRAHMVRVAVDNLLDPGVAKAVDLPWLQELRARLDGRPGAEQVLDPRIAHHTARAGLARARPRRVVPIARELASGRYRRYSSGGLSAARDLLRK